MYLLVRADKGRELLVSAGIIVTHSAPAQGIDVEVAPPVPVQARRGVRTKIPNATPWNFDRSKVVGASTG